LPGPRWNGPPRGRPHRFRRPVGRASPQRILRMSEERPGDRFVFGSVLGLVVMVTWTLVIKYVAPLLYVLSESLARHPPPAIPVMWDFWWVAHLFLAWLLWHRHPRAWQAGVLIAVLEIGIVLIKFAAYLRHPDLSFWRLLWFTNKVYVLAFFVVFL